LREVRKYAGPLPATLAFLPPLKAEHHPAMIAAFAMVDEPEPGVLGAPKDVGSVHLTLLKSDGSGKADTNPNKLIIGRVLGRPIVLAPVNDLLGLAVTEGIEDALSVHQALGLGAWAAGSAPFLPKLASAIPDYVTTLTILVDANEAGRRYSRGLATLLRQRESRKGERPVEIIWQEL
jgi:putative DNA primase/helicase